MKLRMKVAAAVVAAVALLAPMVPAEAQPRLPIAATTDCMASIFAGEFYGQPFVMLLPDTRGLYPPCLALVCLDVVRMPRACALVIVDPSKPAPFLIGTAGTRFAGARVCMTARTYGKVTFNHLGQIVALGYCDV